MTGYDRYVTIPVWQAHQKKQANTKAKKNIVKAFTFSTIAGPGHRGPGSGP